MESPGSPPTVQLDRLLAELQAARLNVSRERGPGHQVLEGTRAQAALLKALEAYVGALAAAGHPVPYRMRDELAIRRRLARSGSPR